MTSTSAGDDRLIETLAKLVTAGEYLDQIPGRPGVGLVDHGRFGTAGSAMRRMYTRGTPEFEDARSAGELERLPDLRAASARNVRQAESRLGREFPPLLRRLYLEVANGGFGPGYGILGVRKGHTDDRGKTAVDLLDADYLKVPGQVLLPLCHWGCAIYSLVDCSEPTGRMWAFDPNPAPEDVGAVFPQDEDLGGWLSRWVDGSLLQPALWQDSTTGEWRGATDAELRQPLED